MALNKKRKTLLLIALERLQKKEIEILAKNQNRSQADLIRKIIQDYLNRLNNV